MSKIRKPDTAYSRVMLLGRERPDLLPLVRLIHDMGDAAFNEGLDELERRGILTAENRGQG